MRPGPRTGGAGLGGARAQPALLQSYAAACEAGPAGPRSRSQPPCRVIGAPSEWTGQTGLAEAIIASARRLLLLSRSESAPPRARVGPGRSPSWPWSGKMASARCGAGRAIAMAHRDAATLHCGPRPRPRRPPPRRRHRGWLSLASSSAAAQTRRAAHVTVGGMATPRCGAQLLHVAQVSARRVGCKHSDRLVARNARTGYIRPPVSPAYRVAVMKSLHMVFIVTFSSHYPIFSSIIHFLKLFFKN